MDFFGDGCWYRPSGTQGSACQPTGTVTWVTVPESATVSSTQPSSPVGWKCGDCGTVMAPWVPAHDCPMAAAPGGILNKGDGCCGHCGDTGAPA